jgi:ATP-dependent NAD(P)H-hydrate dehydratase
LFQPVGWTEEVTSSQSYEHYTLVDGGLGDVAGVEGLKGLENTNRVVNLKIGDFWGVPPVPSDIPGSSAVLSLSIQNLPQPGPWAMGVGASAVEIASQAVKAALDLPLYQGREANHYELHIDASYFTASAKNGKKLENDKTAAPFFRRWKFIFSALGCYSALSLLRLVIMQNRTVLKRLPFLNNSFVLLRKDTQPAALLVSASSTQSFEMIENEERPPWLGFSPSRILRRVRLPRGGGGGGGGRGAGRWLANSAAGRMLGAAASAFTTFSSGSTWNEHRITLLPKCVLPLDESSHKGSSGRLAIIGGSALYTGAPFYAATAALQTGADLVTIFTAKEATTPLKCYSPEFMVQSVYTASEFDEHVEDNLTVDDISSVLRQIPTAQEMVENMIETVCQGISRYHCLVAGPGLGRCPFVGYAVGRILERVRQEQPQMPVILDADALWFLSQSKALWQSAVVQGNSQIILTPNRMELQRLVSASENGTDWADSATVIQKGATDTIGVGLSPTSPMLCTETGGLKRSGGIGDILSGTIATLAAWQSILQQQSNDVENDQSWVPAGWTACHLVKRATREAWQSKKRSMTAPDVLDSLGGVYEDMIGNSCSETDL